MTSDAGGAQPRRRTVLIAGALLPVASSLTSAAVAATRSGAAALSSYHFLTAHQAAVVTEATARLVPGPRDDPAEAGHPGAREAGVTHYIDRLLSAFDHDPPLIFAGAPWSDRHAAGPDRMAHFIPLHERQEKAWRKRIRQLQHDVVAAVKALDDGAKAAGFDGFVAAPTVEQDRLLTELAAVRDLLFGMTIDAMYSVPEYGGNRQLSAWHEISWPGDVQPRGYPPKAVERDDGLDPIAANDLPTVHEAIAALPMLRHARAIRRTRRG